MIENIITFLVKEKLLEFGWEIIVYKPPGGHGGFYIPDP